MFNKIIFSLSLAFIFVFAIKFVYAVPLGGNVVSGSATISTNNNVQTITQATQKAIINWTSFNLGNGQTTTFLQPNTSSVTLNRVIGSQVANIDGLLNANGSIFLVDTHGIFYGKTAQVNVARLTASTRDIANNDFNNGNYNFLQNGFNGSVINTGTINASENVTLIGSHVKAAGTINSLTVKIASNALIVNNSNENQMDTVGLQWMQNQAKVSGAILLESMDNLNLKSVNTGTIVIPLNLTLVSQNGNVTFANQDNTVTTNSITVSSAGNSTVPNLVATHGNLNIASGGNVSFNHLTTLNGNVNITGGNITQLPRFDYTGIMAKGGVSLQGTHIGTDTSHIMINATGNVFVSLLLKSSASGESAFLNNLGNTPSFTLQTNSLGSNSLMNLQNLGTIGQVDVTEGGVKDTVGIGNFGNISNVSADLSGNGGYFTLGNVNKGHVADTIAITSSGSNTLAMIQSISLSRRGNLNPPLQTLSYITTGSHDSLYYYNRGDLTPNKAGSVDKLDLSVQKDTVVKIHE